ncbi:MAG: DNA-binding protein [Bacteroidales bacterium]|nr:DNA-binding protein [Bacteroidales bacterium]
MMRIGVYAGQFRYVMAPDLYNSLNQEKVIREAALRSGISQGIIQACWDAAGEVIKAWATEGHSVALPGLGSMRFSLRAKSVANVAEVSSGLIKSRRIIFTPTTELKEELKSTSVQITCYDRNGELVRRVVSTDPGTVEDNIDTAGEDETLNAPAQNGGSSGSDNGGSEPDAGSDNGGSGNGGSDNSGNEPGNGGSSGSDNGGSDPDGGDDNGSF